MNVNEIDFQNNKTKCINAILGYIFVFYILSAIIQDLTQNVILFMNNMTYEDYISIISSNSITNLLQSANKQYAIVALIASSWSNLMVYLVLTIVCLAFFYKDIANDFYKPINVDEPDTKLNTMLIWLVIFYGVNIASNLLIASISTNADYIDKLLSGSFNLSTTSNNQQILELSIQNGGFIPILLSAGILGPIVEELIYRKGIFGLFKEESYAFLTTSLIFGVIHVLSSLGYGYSPLDLALMTVPYIVSGALFGVMYIRTNQNIWICTAVHMISNLISIFSIFLLY